MPHVRTTLTSAAAIAAVGLAGAGVTGALGASSTQSPRSAPISATVDGFAAVKGQGSVRLIFPTRWTAKASKTALTVTKASDTCTYTVTAKADFVLVDRGADAQALVQAATPGTGPYVLDAGTRGTSAWRVVRRPRTDGRTELQAMRITPTGVTAGRQTPTPAGKQVYLRTTVRALDRPSDECHTGTYRESLGPAIGDALATQTYQGFIQKR
ncbi:hypothetical protein GKE82_20510 [Conexibacter sp. W3-3-2]|uniref:hypothetical protein n=1 Tax=Conexibacter sp. W3-3-2 TaxID=2675227 RepID=UPI0012B8E456|nr:hypothetical protein [Conexibacter sp. W3-3-2]MTD46607.1 hypothetical protein [Conexibacter sp. W3-3-2]